jgi:hypothetical protein
MNYRKSKKRLILVLVNLLLILYNIYIGDAQARVLAAFLLPMVWLSYEDWREQQ